MALLDCPYSDDDSVNCTSCRLLHKAPYTYCCLMDCDTHHNCHACQNATENKHKTKEK